MAIEPETTAERKKLADVLEMMQRQDPTFRAIENEETGQTLISGMGELHLEVIKHRLLRDFNLNVKVHKPRVSYRETIEQAVEVTGECHRQMGGQQLFAEVDASAWSRLRARHRAGHGHQPLPARRAARRAAGRRSWTNCVHRGEGGGILGGFPLIAPEDHGPRRRSDATSTPTTSPSASPPATPSKRACARAGPVLLEPIMRLDITTPEEYLGDFVGDLQQRRAIIHKTDNRGKLVSSRPTRRWPSCSAIPAPCAASARAGPAVRWNRSTTPRPLPRSAKPFRCDSCGGSMQVLRDQINGTDSLPMLFWPA